MTLRLGAYEPPPGRPLRVHLAAGAGLRALVVADLLRRVAERRRHHVLLTVAPETAADRDWTDYNIRPFETTDTGAHDLLIVPEGSDGLVVPCETGDPGPAPDPLYTRLAILEIPYGEPLHLDADRLGRAEARLNRWREQVAQWAAAPGRPLDRPHAAEAEDALAADLDAPAALAALDRLAADPDVAPGAKIETFVHLDLLLGFNLVADIGRA
ncbi:hypothetical protein [Actinomadura hibisca]|uniref:hypothetical protein n=1 Tax=Actinomadura hibisca TaxID=68565 RepID=UPI00082E12BF|nr:hypothetical protein [Actinomadura hibisca]